jgi:hypothetical protein
MGYVGYQNEWPEQTPKAVDLLTTELEGIGITLHLPVYAVATKQAARVALSRLGLSEESLEQKCQLQKNHVSLENAELGGRLYGWAAGMRRAFRDPPMLTVVERRQW